MSVPKLRFPDFRDAGEWEIKEFSKYIVLYRGSSPRPIQNYLSIDSSGVNWIKIGDTKSAKNFVISQVEEKITPEGAKKSRKVNVGELILANSMSYGKTYQVAIDGYIYDGWFVLRDYEKYFDKQFLLQLLNSEYMQSQYERFSAGGIVQNISSDIVYKTVLPHTLLKEQKKIADCLSSIDDRITAETQKLDTLKAHKKGLMQQLFPAEGETLPKLRFPEFHKSGEWEEKSIQDLIDKKIIIGHLDGNHGALYPRAEEFSKEGVPYISANDFITGHIDFNRCKYISVQRALQFKKGVAKDGDILFAHNATVGPVAKLSTNFQFVILSTTATYFRCNQKYLINDFLKFALSSPSFVKQYTSVMSQSTRNQVPITTQRKFNLQIPSIQEQQKIADCLTSINEAIAAQSQAIELLKLHKKGLMQQLFPSVEEVKR
ncbi:MAG: restriction endonuclease subunit S [Pseudanabaena sp.]|jgi:type I restriction enzyme S subunit